MNEQSDITWGGFIPSNIHRWIIKECIESGDPDNMFLAIRDAVEEIEDSQLNDGSYLEHEAERLGLA